MQWWLDKDCNLYGNTHIWSFVPPYNETHMITWRYIFFSFASTVPTVTVSITPTHAIRDGTWYHPTNHRYHGHQQHPTQHTYTVIHTYDLSFHRTTTHPWSHDGTIFFLSCIDWFNRTSSISPIHAIRDGAWYHPTNQRYHGHRHKHALSIYTNKTTHFHLTSKNTHTQHLRPYICKQSYTILPTRYAPLWKTTIKTFTSHRPPISLSRKLSLWLKTPM